MSTAKTCGMRAGLLVLCLLAVTGCFSDSPTAPAPIDQELTLAPGESRTIPDSPVSIQFIGVTGDNRCPADAICILGGSATVQVSLTTRQGTRTEATFETGNPKPVSHGSLTLELVQLMPYPFSATPIRPEDYRATIRAKRP